MLVDATDGSITLAISDLESAGRIVCDQNNVRKNLNDLNTYACNEFSAAGLAATTRREGQPASTVDSVNRAYDYLGATLSFYSTNFGRNSFDGRGAQARATTRACQTNPILGGDHPVPVPERVLERLPARLR